MAGLGNLDPLTVPLPHGTEITTRVDKLAGETRIPQGSIGRVARIRDHGCDVQIVGVGEVWYARNELLPRRPGQLRFALRRDFAWTALKPCAVLEAVVGSRAWGLADDQSDTDLRGIFALPYSWKSGLVTPPLDLVSAGGSATYWETHKAIEQGLRADPNTLELLFLPGARALDPIGEWLLRERDAFVSQELFGSFGRYAVSQLRKLTRANQLAGHREQVLEWLREEPMPALDEVARRLAAFSPKPGATKEDALFTAKEYVKQLYRSLHDQGLLHANDFASLIQYAREGGASPAGARELRPKNAYNLLRLISTAAGWLKSGAPQFEVQSPLRERMLEIKKGNVRLEEVLLEAEALVPELDAARAASQLPARPDYVRANRLARRIGEELARRWTNQEPGPFGRDAPAPPEMSMEGET